MIDRDHDLSVTGQARVLNISRSSVYCLPRPVSPDLALMRRVDELHLVGSARAGEREEISRGIAAGLAMRAIARSLGAIAINDKS